MNNYNIFLKFWKTDDKKKLVNLHNQIYIFIYIYILYKFELYVNL